jgi:hypothetical protein
MSGPPWHTLREKIEYLAATWKTKPGLEMAGRELELSLTAYPDAPVAPAPASREMDEQDCTCIAPHPACSNCNGTGKVTP